MEALGRGKRRLEVDGNPELPERLRVEDEEEEEREIQELEREVSEMARRVLDARKTNLDRILGGLSSELVAKRPPLPPRALTGSDAGETGDFSDQLPPSLEPNGGSLLGNADRTMVEKLLLFRAKMEGIISETPVVLKRANECILQIEKLEKCDVTVPSIFNRR
ncbi:hypothetical protein ZIOFF_035994 [Zingiber officinale]|uniref:Uncharacterized protein n=1 Tax=Zingiber officinale TaxID=94328 RepID=A0A8J5G9K6_ZINOF|nr:hypothetical protein ZIOFF_035994 [Zingiber officinale]